MRSAEQVQRSSSGIGREHPDAGLVDRAGTAARSARQSGSASSASPSVASSALASVQLSSSTKSGSAVSGLSKSPSPGRSGIGVPPCGGHDTAPARRRRASAGAGRHGAVNSATARRTSGRDLLGLLEIGVRDILEAVALERDDALVALHVRALVDGHGEMALAEQLAGLGLAALDRPASTASASKRA